MEVSVHACMQTCIHIFVHTSLQTHKQVARLQKPVACLQPPNRAPNTSKHSFVLTLKPQTLAGYKLVKTLTGKELMVHAPDHLIS